MQLRQLTGGSAAGDAGTVVGARSGSRDPWALEVRTQDTGTRRVGRADVLPIRESSSRRASDESETVGGQQSGRPVPHVVAAPTAYGIGNPGLVVLR